MAGTSICAGNIIARIQLFLQNLRYVKLVAVYYVGAGNWLGSTVISARRNKCAKIWLGDPACLDYIFESIGAYF